MSKDFDLNEIRKRQQQLIEMKKVKQGQKEAPVVDLEAEKLVPKTAKEKRQNFWYHYKWATIGAILLTALLIFGVVDLLNNEKYDLTIMAFNQYQGLFSREKQAETFEKYAIDLDKDGKVNVLLNSNQTMPSANTGQFVDPKMVQASSAKLFTGMQTFEGFIFLLDETVYNSIVTDPETGEKRPAFLDLSKYTAENPAFQGDKLYLKDTGLMESWNFSPTGSKELPDDLFVCLRDYTKQKNPDKNIQKKYQSEKAVFEKLIGAVLSGETKQPPQTESNPTSQAGSTPNTK